MSVALQQLNCEQLNKHPDSLLLEDLQGVIRNIASVHGIQDHAETILLTKIKGVLIEISHDRVFMFLIKIMKLIVNGDTLSLDGNTIADLVAQLELTGRRLAVEVNREIIPKSQHADFTLNEGDVLEIVHAIGGG